MVNRGEITAICKKCGRASAASDFILDTYAGIMVCSNCFKKRKDISNKTKVEIEDEKRREEEKRSRPAGWDKEDEYLERVAKTKKELNIAKKIDDINVKYLCPGCKYSFKYNTKTKLPNSCPYCGLNVSDMKVL
jgi:DNA-directed RNA polymerase subunit RPC12/RpoP